MSNILIISSTKSFIIASVTEQLQSKEHTVFQANNDLGEIEAVKDKIQALILYVDEDLISEMKLLVYLKDRVLEEDISVILLGEQEHFEDIECVIPHQFIKKMYPRPLNVREVVDYVDEYLKNDDANPKKKILVVDDSGAMLRNVKAWLEDKYQVILANSGVMAIKYLALKRPDLVLLDYEMPVCDGRQVLEMIRSESEFSNIPVIFLTSKNDRETVLKVSALKPEGYLLKTMEPAQIVNTIDEFFEKRKGITFS